ncbi:MAG: hypothetical protein ACREQ9_18170, partial [Candidatus Binatia bacterium]
MSSGTAAGCIVLGALALVCLLATPEAEAAAALVARMDSLWEKRANPGPMEEIIRFYLISSCENEKFVSSRSV